MKLRRKNSFFILSILVCIFMSGINLGSQPIVSLSEESLYAPGEFIVKFKNDSTLEDDVNHIYSKYSCESVENRKVIGSAPEM